MKALVAVIWAPFFYSCIFYVALSHVCDKVNNNLLKKSLSTKTGYFNAIKDDSLWEFLKEEAAAFDCSTIKVWFLTRHGTRYPVGEDLESFKKLPNLIEQISSNFVKGLGCLTENDIHELEQWHFPYGLHDKGQLHPAGEDELYTMGNYWRNLFPTIFQYSYNASEIKVEFTVRNRTGQSAYHFLRGMYGDDAIGKIELPKPHDPNYILRFYKSCPKWLHEVYRNNETTYRERNLFRTTQYFKDMVQSVSARLGFTSYLPFGDISSIYNECRYETAWFPEKESVWCKAFSESDIQVLEFDQDLKYYYEDSYGTPMNKEMACRTLSDLYFHLKKSVISSGRRPRAVLYFSHDKALLKFQALLGLFRPPLHLKHDDFLNQHRQFYSSRVAPFATNLGFVLYKCGMDHKVALFFQGNPIRLQTVCPDVWCDWEQYESFLKPISEECDLAKTCSLHDEL